MSRIFFGTAIKPMLMGKNVEALLDAVLASGINAFDCARGYGLAEKSLGKWIRERNNRDRIVLLTKCGNVNMKGEVRVNRKVILSELNKSLKTLGVKEIDIYLLHRDDQLQDLNGDEADEILDDGTGVEARAAGDGCRDRHNQAQRQVEHEVLGQNHLLGGHIIILPSIQ